MPASQGVSRFGAVDLIRDEFAEEAVVDVQAGDDAGDALTGTAAAVDVPRPAPSRPPTVPGGR